MRLLPLAILLVLVAAAAPAPAAMASARSHRAAAAPCAAKRSTTVALNTQARVYVRAERGDADQHELVGCLLGSGRSVQLDSWFSCDCSRGDESAPQVWLRGTVVALNRFSCPPDPLLGGCVGGAHTFDVRTRRTLREADTGTAVSALVQGPRGAFAYVTSGGAVAKSDASGEAVVLDPGPEIDFGSLAIAGARVYWLRAGAPQTALLTP